MNKYTLVTFFVAFCSFSYEMLYAQILSVTNGGTVLNYSLTIGLYLFSLGIGSYVYEKIKVKPKKLFTLVELSLSQIGLWGALFIIGIAMLWFRHHFPLHFVLLYIPVILVGFLSGFELPLLVKLSKFSFTKVLGIAYVGNLFAAVLFPLFFFPIFGLIETAIIIPFFNLLLAMFIGYKEKYLTKTLTLVGVIHIIMLLSMFWIQNWIMFNFV